MRHNGSRRVQNEVQSDPGGFKMEPKSIPRGSRTPVGDQERAKSAQELLKSGPRATQERPKKARSLRVTAERVFQAPSLRRRRVPECPQGAPKRFQGRPRAPQERPRTTKERPKSCIISISFLHHLYLIWVFVPRTRPQCCSCPGRDLSDFLIYKIVFFQELFKQLSF